MQATGGQVRTVKAFMVELRYDGPPELLTMYLCLILNKNVLAFGLGWLQENMPSFPGGAVPSLVPLQVSMV
jgi:hypothetical protein